MSEEESADNKYIIEFMAYREDDLGKSAEKFHEENPSIYDLFKDFADVVKDSGHDYKFGAGCIWHRLRWEVAFEKKENASYKLNSNHCAYYSRKLMAENPEFHGYFNLRRCRSNFYNDDEPTPPPMGSDDDQYVSGVPYEDRAA